MFSLMTVIVSVSREHSGGWKAAPGANKQTVILLECSHTLKIFQLWLRGSRLPRLCGKTVIHSGDTRQLDPVKYSFASGDVCTLLTNADAVTQRLRKWLF